MIGVELGVLMLPSHTPPAQIRELPRRFSQYRTPLSAARASCGAWPRTKHTPPTSSSWRVRYERSVPFHTHSNPLSRHCDRPPTKDSGFSKEPSRVIWH